MSEAKFYDISSYIDTEYEKNEFVKLNKEEFKNNIKNYLENHSEIKSGDIIFVGNDYETRQDYGFGLVVDNNKFILDNYGPYLPLRNKDKLPKDITYSSLLELMKNNDYLYSLWYGDSIDSFDEIKEEYIKQKIY